MIVVVRSVLVVVLGVVLVGEKSVVVVVVQALDMVLPPPHVALTRTLPLSVDLELKYGDVDCILFETIKYMVHLAVYLQGIFHQVEHVVDDCSNGSTVVKYLEVLNFSAYRHHGIPSCQLVDPVCLDLNQIATSPCLLHATPLFQNILEMLWQCNPKSPPEHCG